MRMRGNYAPTIEITTYGILFRMHAVLDVPHRACCIKNGVGHNKSSARGTLVRVL